MTGASTIRLEPRVRLLVAAANRLDPRTPETPMSQRRIEGAIASRRFLSLAVRRPTQPITTTHVSVPVDGGRITVRIYRPASPTRTDLPLHVFFHGGGWCAGTLDDRDGRCHAIAVGADCVVASVDYRLAPENQYPTAPEDCYAALCWLVEHRDELGVDASRLSVSGESAGANLAAVVCLMARDRSGPSITYQWLDVPATDLTMTQPSALSTPDGYMLDRAAMLEYRANYLTDVSQETEPYASPLHADDLTGLPPAWILTCGADPLRDEGKAYAEALRAAGVPVEHTHLAGHVHASWGVTRFIPSAAEYEDAAIAALRRALHAG